MRHNKLTLATIAAGLLMSGYGADVRAATVAQTVEQGKPRAPVGIVAAVQANKAVLTITFETAAEQVTVRVYGTDGLTVSGSETPVIGGSFAAGQTLTLPVGYTAGEGQSNLAVQVNGQFAGNQRSRISSFTVGGTRAATRARSATVVDEKGQRLVVLPAEDK